MKKEPKRAPLALCAAHAVINEENELEIQDAANFTTYGDGNSLVLLTLSPDEMPELVRRMTEEMLRASADGDCAQVELRGELTIPGRSIRTRREYLEEMKKEKSNAG